MSEENIFISIKTKDLKWNWKDPNTLFFSGYNIAKLVPLFLFYSDKQYLLKGIKIEPTRDECLFIYPKNHQDLADEFASCMDVWRETGMTRDLINIFIH